MGTMILWAFFFAFAHAADPAPVNTGGATYVPPSAANDPAVRNALNPGSAPAGGKGPTNIGQIPTPETIPPPSAAAGQSFGQFRNSKNEVKLDRMFLNRYKQSVVRVTARDLAGNPLAQAMGVGIGRSTLASAQYIATTLSIVLGNSQQWADEIEITHHTGNRYTAKVALIDEEKNLVLLSPEATPAAIPFVAPQNERPQVEVFTFSFKDNNSTAEGENLEGGGGIEPQIHRGLLAAANPETGVLSVSGKSIDNTQSGSGIINTTGELVGMLLPGGRGVLASTLQRMMVKASKSTPIDPTMIGAILGRGVLVDPKLPGAFPTITAALEAIKKGEAPKADITRYTPAKNRALAPKESDKVVVKVMPGNYKEAKTLVLPSDISLSGSGADITTIVGSDPDKPVLLLQDVENVILSGFRIVPAPLQKMKAPTVIFSKTKGSLLLGNILEAKGGVAFWAHESQALRIAGNTFPKGEARAISCDKSAVIIESNAFIGDWPIAITGDKSCSGEIRRNLFLENKAGISLSALVSKIAVDRNSFIRTTAAIKLSGENPNVSIDDNVFFENLYAVYASGDFDVKRIGRNSIWKTKFVARGRPLKPSDSIRTEPQFENPALYDFRIKPGKGQLGVAAKETGADLGAYQRSDFLGSATQQLVRTLSAATGDDSLPEAWGLE
jgi:hypothetical protein